MQYCPRVRRCLPPLLIQMGVVEDGRAGGPEGGAYSGPPIARCRRARRADAPRSPGTPTVGLLTPRLALILRGHRYNF